MKTVLKFIASFICYAAFIPCVLAFTVCLTWYLLPAFQVTSLGTLINSHIEQDLQLLTTILIGCFTLLLMIFGKVFTVIKKSKALNFYTHLITWLVAIVLAAESVYTFIASVRIHTSAVALSPVRKIGILVCAVALLLYAVIAPKVRLLVDRRIQSYDTAKELNVNGRSSVVGMQILKCLDFICPELFLLIALCFAFNWEISVYFLFIIAAFCIPIIGNMICDGRVKREAVQIELEKQEAQVNSTAEAVVDLLKSNGAI